MTYDEWKLQAPNLDAPDSDFEEEDYEPDYIGEFPHGKAVEDADI